jgi:hypothetical protein
VTLPAQTPAGSVKFENVGSPLRGSARAIALTANLTGVKYTAAEGCLGGPGTFEDGVYTGESQTLKAFSGSNEVGFYIANSQVEQPPLFNSSSFPYTLEATNTAPLVEANWGSTRSMSCTSLTGTTKPTTWTGELKLSATWSGCKLLGFQTVSVAMNSCRLAAHLQQWSGITAATGTLGISCEKAGDSVVFTYNGCQSSWPAQEGEPVRFEVVGSGAEQHIVVSEPTARNMTYTLSSCGSGTYHDGAILGGWNFVGKNGSGMSQAVWLE